MPTSAKAIYSVCVGLGLGLILGVTVVRPQPALSASSNAPAVVPVAIESGAGTVLYLSAGKRLFVYNMERDRKLTRVMSYDLGKVGAEVIRPDSNRSHQN